MTPEKHWYNINYDYFYDYLLYRRVFSFGLLDRFDRAFAEKVESFTIEIL